MVPDVAENRKVGLTLLEKWFSLNAFSMPVLLKPWVLIFFTKGSYYEQTVKKTDFHQWLVNIMKILIIVLHLNSV